MRGSERDMLVGWLDFHRETLALKCEGLSSEQLADRAVPLSYLSLAGLLRHMAEVERTYFRRTFAGEDVSSIPFEEDPFREDPDADYASHNGHADLLRERIDGTTGE